MLGNGGELTFDNVVHERYGVKAHVAVSAAADLCPSECYYTTLETSTKMAKSLHFLPRKAAENDWIISGQAAPVVSKGVFLYDGGINDGTNHASGTLNVRPQCERHRGSSGWSIV